MRKEHTVLLVDDEPHIIAALKRVLQDLPVKILSASNGNEGLGLLGDNEVHIVVSDERMPQMAGSDFLALVKERHPATIRMMLTGHASIEAAMHAVNAGAIYRFFMKPWNDLEVVLAVKSACDLYDVEEENRLLLRMVRIHQSHLQNLEQKFPEIPQHERNADGNIVLSGLSSDEVDRMLGGLGKG
jgi:two-component system probable response regulator PhcQ